MTEAEQRALHTALAQAAPGIREFLALWGNQLTPERVDQLADWQSKGLRVGLHWAMPFVDVTLVDANGEHRVLERLDFRTMH